MQKMHSYFTVKVLSEVEAHILMGIKESPQSKAFLSRENEQHRVCWWIWIINFSRKSSSRKHCKDLKIPTTKPLLTVWTIHSSCSLPVTVGKCFPWAHGQCMVTARKLFYSVKKKKRSQKFGKHVKRSLWYWKGDRPLCNLQEVLLVTLWLKFL